MNTEKSSSTRSLERRILQSNQGYLVIRCASLLDLSSTLQEIQTMLIGGLPATKPVAEEASLGTSEASFLTAGLMSPAGDLPSLLNFCFFEDFFLSFILSLFSFPYLKLVISQSRKTTRWMSRRRSFVRVVVHLIRHSRPYCQFLCVILLLK